MRYRALGPLTVEVEGRNAKLGGLRQQIVLAVLLRSANRVIPQDSLIDTVWAGEPPEAARATVQSYIYNLRQVLGSDAIERRGDGYLIEVDPTTFDVLDFEEGIRTGTGLLDEDPAAARAALVEALDLWYGTAYGGVDHPELDPEIKRLDDKRVTAIEARIEADLALGGSGELVSELESLVREHPLRERFWGQLMLALYRSGRQAEALRAFQRARSHLVEHLGIEPGAELQSLEDRILDHDPSLTVPTTTPADRRHQSVRGYELRDVIGEGEVGVVYQAYQPSVGREVAVKVIRAADANQLAFVARFEREAQRVANLEHPHLLPLYDYWRDPSGAFLVTPLMRGGSLASSLRAGPWSLGPALHLADQVGGALAFAHRRGVVHGDVKAENVLLDEDGNAYLSDFGIATAPDTGPGRSDIPATIRTDVLGLGELVFEMLSGVAPTAASHPSELVEAAPGLPESVATVVGRAMASDPDERYPKVDDFLRDLRRTAGVDVVSASEVVDQAPAKIRNPYKGLRAFAEEDAVDFHGRDALIADLLERIAAHRLVTVVGPSGSGKSSVVRAGLIPAMRAGSLPDSRNWLVTDMFPGSHPFEELEAALTRVAVRTPIGILGELTQPNGLLRVSKQILPSDDSTLLIVVDQFEELFSTVRSEETRRSFLDNLIAVAGDERGRVRVVCTIRADFLDRPLAYGDFAEAIADGVVTVGPPTRDGLAQAVAAPARTVGLDLEPGLVSRIVGDVEGQPGALPLLQYALTEMVANRASSTLTIAGYEATGEIAGALSRRAEELYGSLPPAGEVATREIFLRMVSVDEMGVVTRRRTRQAELVSLDIERGGLEAALKAFAGFRLITFDRDPVTRGPTVEVAHESLLTAWERLEGWIDQARESLVMARRVGESTQEWIDSGEDPSYLLRGGRLEDVEAWTSGADVMLTADEARFINAGSEQRAAEISTARRRRRRAVTALAAGLAVVSVLAVVAVVQRGRAQDEALDARVRELAVASEAELDHNRELALLIATEAFDAAIAGGRGPDPAAVSAMAQAIADWRLVSRFPSGPRIRAELSPDGSLVAVSSKTNAADVDVFASDGELVGTLSGPDEPGTTAWAVAFSPDVDTVAVVYASVVQELFRSLPDGVADIEIFDLGTMSSVQQIDTDHGWVHVSYSPDGEQLALSGSNEVRVLTLDGAEASRFEAAGAVGRPLFLDDDLLLTPVKESGLTIHDVSDGSVVDQIEIAGLDPNIVAINAGHTHVAYRAGEHVRVMDLATGNTIFDKAAPSVLTVALDPDATRIAHSGYDPDVYVEPLVEGETGLTLHGTDSNVFSLAFSGEKELLSSGTDALLWDVSPEGIDDLGGVPLQMPQWGYQISADERWLTYVVSINTGGPIGDPEDGRRMIDLDTGEEMTLSQGEYNTLGTGLRLVNQDFTMVGSLTLEGESSIRRLPSWEVAHQLDPCRGPLALTPDAGLVVLSGWSCADQDLPDLATSSILDLASGTEVPLPFPTLFSAEFNPEGVFDGGSLLAMTDQLSAAVWDVDGQRLIGQIDLRDHPEFGAIIVITFDPTGRHLVGGTADGSVWVVDLEQVVAGTDMDEAIVFNRQAHAGAAPAPSINGHGMVGSAGFDGMVRLWDLESEDLILEFGSDIGTPMVAFSPDGTELLYPDGLSIRRMPVDPDELRALAGELLTRDFLPDECARYAEVATCENGSG